MKQTRQTLIGFALVLALMLVVVSLMLAGSAQAASFATTATPKSMQQATPDAAPPQAPELLQSPQEAGGPDAFGYTYQDSNEPGGPIYAWDEISGTGTLVTGWSYGNEGSAGPFPLGFDFPFYGNSYDQFYPATWGYVSFGQAYNNYPYSWPPSSSQPNNDIIAYGAYMGVYTPDAGVYYQTLSNPQRFVIEFVNLSYYGGCPRTFEIVLYPTGDTESRYQEMRLECGLYGPVGIENEDGSDGLGYWSTLANSLAIRYSYPLLVSLLPEAQNGFAKAGETVVYTLTLQNFTQQTDNFLLSLQPGNTWTTILPITHTGPLANGESLMFTVEVDIPLDAIPSESDDVTIMATSTISPTEYAVTATLHTLTASGEYGYVAVRDQNYLAVVDTAGFYVSMVDLEPFGCTAPESVDIPPDGDTIWVACYSTHNIVVLDRQTYTLLGMLNLRGPLVFSQDSRQAFVGVFDDQANGYFIDVFDTTSFALITTIPLTMYAFDMVMHPYLPIAYIVSASYYQVSILDTQAYTLTDQVKINAAMFRGEISHDGKYLFTSGVSEKVRFFDTRSKQFVETIEMLGRETGEMAVSGDDETLFISAPPYATNQTGYINLIDVPSASIVQTITFPSNNYWNGPYNDIVLTCDEQRLLVSKNTSDYYAEPEVMVLNTTTYSPTATFVLPMRYFNSTSPVMRPLVACPQYVGSGVFLAPDTQQLQGGRGEAVPFTLQLINATGVTDTFTLSLGSHSWDAGLSALSLGPIAPWGNVTFTVSMTVPHGIDWYSTDSVTVTATSVASPTLQAQASVTAQAYAAPELQVNPSAFNLTQVAGEVATRTLTVSNSDALTLTYNITSSIRIGWPYYTTTTDNENNFHTGYMDDDMDRYILWEYNNSPIEFNIFVDSEVELTGNYLGVYVYDNLPIEVNHVHLNGVDLGILAPGEGIWNESLFELPAGLVHPGKNLVEVFPGFYGDWQSGVWLDWGRLYINNPTVPWMNFAPISGSLNENASQPVVITLDSTGMQPGDHNAYVQVYSNDPDQPLVHLPVTMTLVPTDSMGWVEGTVTDVRSDLPLTATLRALGQPYVLQTDPATGLYKLWLEPGQYTLQVMADDYVTQTAEITISTQAGLEQDFALMPDFPHIVTTPAFFAEVVFVGTSETNTLTIINDGPQPLTYTLHEFEETLPIRILSWKGCFSDNDVPRYASMLNALASYATKPYTITETTSDNPLVLAGLLQQNDVLLLPLQRYSYCNWYDIGISWRDSLQQFISDGGTVVVLDDYWQGYATTSSILNASGLMYSSYYYPGYYNPEFQVVAPEHPVVRGLPSEFQVGEVYFTSFETTNGLMVVQSTSDDGAAVAVRDFGTGFVTLMNFGVFNQYSGQILANAIEWRPYMDVPWLSEIPAIGNVPAYSTQEVYITLDARGFPPGEYVADVYVESNDPENPLTSIPVTMTVAIPPNAGRVVGAVSDAWSASPLTATVLLENVYAVHAVPVYEIWALPGTYSLTAFAPGYYTLTQVITLSAETTLTQDIALEPAQPRLGTLVENITVNTSTGNSTSQILTIQNLGPVPLEISLNEIAAPESLFARPQMNGLLGKHILFDRKHSQWEITLFNGILANDLTNAGAIIDDNWQTIDADVLAGYDILWVNPNTEYAPWTPDEAAAVRQWVDAGGSVFVHRGPYASDLTSVFGVQLSCVGWDVPQIFETFNEHPITRNIDRIYSRVDCTLTPGEGQTIVYNDYDNPHVVVAETGQGKVFVIADLDFSDSNIVQEDNLSFARNVFQWLAIQYSNISWFSQTPISATIPAHSSLDVTLGFDANSLAPGTYTGTLVIEHNDLAQDFAYIPITMTVTANGPALSLLPETQQGQGYAGETVVYTLTLTNLGSETDTFALATNGAWASSLSATTTGPLEIGETFTFTVAVSIPAGTPMDVEQAITITATSTLLPTLSDSASVTTRVAAFPISGSKIYLPLLMKP